MGSGASNRIAAIRRDLDWFASRFSPPRPGRVQGWAILVENTFAWGLVRMEPPTRTPLSLQ
eukprot:7161692-Prymnesium_polylepis.1